MKPFHTLLRALVLLALIAALFPTRLTVAAEPRPPVEIFGPGPCTAGSVPKDLVTGEATVYFAAYDDLHGYEIYRSDGAPAGTWRVTELAPGAESLQPDLRIVVGGRLYFTTNEPPGAASFKQRLWVTDGAPAAEGSTGAVELPDFWPEASGYTISTLTELNGEAYFIVKNPSDESQAKSRSELWRTDGTGSGTRLVKAYTPYPYRTDEPFAYQGYLYFAGGTDPFYLGDLWRSDGTPEGTGPFGEVASPYGFTLSGGFLYFFSSGSLYRTDGTLAGTIKVAGLPYDSSPWNLTDANGTLYFTNRAELWHSDGTAAGTHLIKAIGSTVFETAPAELTAVGSTLFFSAGITDYDRELWKSDGTPAGTVQVKDLRPGPYGSHPEKLKAFGGKLYFITRHITTDAEQFWRSDGTAAGTQVMLDSGFFPWDGIDGEIAVASNRLFFSGMAPCAGWELQTISAGSPALQLAADINTAPMTTRMFYTITGLGGTGYFFANDYIHGIELWRSNGTPQGTRMVKDINPTGSTFVNYFPPMVAAGPQLYFNVDNNSGQQDLWRSDGTAAGTQPVRQSDGSAVQTDLYGATAFQNRLFYFTEAVPGDDLWKTDGTPAGTQKIAHLPGRSNGVELNGKLYYLVASSISEQWLWVTDGTPAGTKMIMGLGWSSTTLSPRSGLLRIGERLYFLNYDAHGVQPWVTDGTAAGTHILAEVSGETISIAGSKDTLYVLTEDSPGYRLWTNRGAAVGSLTLLRESASLRIDDYSSAGGKFFFIDNQYGTYAPSLWASDGTVDGTRDLLPYGGDVQMGYSLFAAPPYVFFTATGAAGEELWQSDGTPEGTHRLAGLQTDERWIMGYDGARLYFAAADGSMPERQVPGSAYYAYNTLTEQLFLPVTLR